MSSHWEWVEEVSARHDAEKPFAPENGQPLKFGIGEWVIYTNDYGIEFAGLRVTGFYKPAGPDGLYANGARYLINTNSPWMPVSEASLRIDENVPERAYGARWGEW
ncbi:hypothetical protein [Cupriavidus metallidurans]|uniref:hypothetical protein n=1 Tax=Cupriavidus metallidurans TaxID=119219 RepID=UPI001CCF8995|nr:hypothetical protein [Cupriavidus metallidurans]UBM12796.1 hypothetical protein LAI70_27980 [Cupriavidus metallidurans]